jgi:hypothetical protein
MPQKRTPRDGCRDARGYRQPDKPSSSADGIHKSFTITMAPRAGSWPYHARPDPAMSLGCAWLAGVRVHGPYHSVLGFARSTAPEPRRGAGESGGGHPQPSGLVSPKPSGLKVPSERNVAFAG